MPYIDMTTSVSVSSRKEQVIKEKMGRAIELIPGKTESWLMINFHDHAAMYFNGTDDPCAILEIKVFGAAEEMSFQYFATARSGRWK